MRWVVGEMINGGGDLEGQEGEHGVLAKGLGIQGLEDEVVIEGY